MKNSLLALLICFSSTLTFAQWDLIATQATAPEALAIDSCGNAFARVANRIYRSADMGQTWESILDVPGILSPNYQFNTIGGTVHLSMYSDQSGVLYDYNFECNGSIDTAFIERNPNCADNGITVVQDDHKRVFQVGVFQPRFGIQQVALFYDDGTGNGLQDAPSQLPEAFYYVLNRSTGALQFNRVPQSIPVSGSTNTISVEPLAILNSGWSIAAAEQSPDLSFLDYSVILFKRNASSVIDSIAVATYSVSNEEWSTVNLPSAGVVSARTYNNDKFLISYQDRLEVRSASSSADLIQTINLPNGFVLGNFTDDLGYIIGTNNGRVVTIHNGVVVEAEFLVRGFSNWNPTLSGSILVPTGAGFAEYTDVSNTPVVIDLDVEERFLLSETFGGYSYSIRQLNDRKQFLATSPSGATEVLIDDLTQELIISEGGDDTRVVRIGRNNFLLSGSDLSPMLGQFSSHELRIRGVDTLFYVGDTSYVKRGNDLIKLSKNNSGISNLSYSTPLISGNVYFVQSKSVAFAPKSSMYVADVFDIQTLERVAQFYPKGPLVQIGESIYIQQTEGQLTSGSDGLSTAIAEVSWDGNQVVFEPLIIPTVKYRDAGELCFDDFWQSFTHIVSGYTNLKHLNGSTFISGIHGVFKSEDCIIPRVQREDVCLEPGETFMWNGQAIDTPGFYSAISTSPNACDEIAYLLAGQATLEQSNECFLEGGSIAFQDTSYSLPGTYTFEAVDAAGCSQLQELTITPPDTFRLDTMVMLGEVLFGEEVVSNGQQITSSRDVADCSDIVIYTVSLVSSTSQVNGAEKLSVYPTLLGADRTFHIETAGQQILNVAVFTLSGKQVNVYQNSDQWQLDTPQAGWYIVRIQTDQGSSNTRILVN